MKFVITLICSLLGTALTADPASAAFMNQSFLNEFDTTSIHFWSDDATKLAFDRVSFGQNMGAWSVESNTGDTLVLAGPVVAATRGRFSLRLDHDRQPFSMQWAEVFFDGAFNVIRGSGTLHYSGSAWTGSDLFTHALDIPNQFSSSAVVPLPSSVVLLLSSLLFVPLRGLRRRAAA